MFFKVLIGILTVKIFLTLFIKSTMANLKIILLVIIFAIQTNYSQNWLKIDSVFSPSGVTMQAFSAPAFGDLDGDGDFDLILGSINDKADCFQNITTQLPSLFRKDTSMLYSIYAGGLQFTNADYPSLIDLDSDNDLDLVIGGYNGLLYYKNIGDTINAIWQKVDSIFANSVNPQIGSDARPAFADLDNDGDLDLLVGIGESLLGGPTPGLTFGFRNVGTLTNPIFSRDDNLVIGIPDVGLNSYPALADLDNDDDYDLLIGRDLSSLAYYKNTGTPTIPIWTRDFTTFAGVETTNYWKDPTFCDLDVDGDLDLIYGTDDGNLYFYQNTGTISNPQFQYNATYFPVIKVNGSSTVSFADFDNDGDYDLLSGSTLDKMQYLRNDGTPAKSKFVKTTAPFSSLNPGFRCSPVFVDIDKDNDFDIVSGADNGMIYCYINNGSSFSVNTSYFGSIDVGYASAPAFVDIDADGDEDVLIGAEIGVNYLFLQREGNSFITPTTNPFATITFADYSRPSFTDLDNDGDFDLILGKSFGELNCYENIGNAQNPQWQRNDILVAELEVKQNSAPGFADLDKDGRIDCVVGEYDGNFTYFKNLFAPTAIENEFVETPKGFYLCQNFPNPFNPSTRIQYQVSSISHISLKVFDILGNEIATLVNEEKQPGTYEFEFVADRRLVSGVYLCRLKTATNTKIIKMILLR
jgi:hypothetical protein